jgi:hypothetical protein
MRLGIAIAADVIAGLICLAAGSAPGVIVCVLMLGYLASLITAPTIKCISCGGSGRHGDVLGSRGIRRCWTCRGHKEYVRLGTRLLRPHVARGLRAGQHGKNW